MRAAIATACCLVLAGVAAPQERAAPPAVARLVADLASETWPLREAAEEALAALGEPALPALRAAERHDDAEVRQRARGLVRRIAVVPEAEFEALRTRVWTLLASDRPRAEALAELRAALAEFADAHPLRGDGPPRVCRSADGRVVCAIGRTLAPGAGGADEPDPVATAGAPALARARDPRAELVLALGGRGAARRGEGQAGGGAEAWAGAGVALALGGRGGDSLFERLPNGNLVVTAWARGGTAAAAGATAGLGFTGRDGELPRTSDPGQAPEQGGDPADPVPEVDDATWARLQAFARARAKSPAPGPK